MLQSDSRYTRESDVGVFKMAGAPSKPRPRSAPAGPEATRLLALQLDERRQRVNRLEDALLAARL